MEVRAQLVDLTVRYGGVVFPFSLEEFTKALPHRGFVVHEPILPQFNNRSIASGVVAQKGEARVHVAGQHQSIGVVGDDPKKIVEEFDAVEDLLSSELNFRSEASAVFYEVLAQARIRSSGNNPLVVMQHPSNSAPSIERLQIKLGHPAAGFGIRLVPPGSEPNSVRWFDIRIEADILQPTEFYFAGVVYRDSARDVVIESAKRVFGLVEDLINVLEGGVR